MRCIIPILALGGFFHHASALPRPDAPVAYDPNTDFEHNAREQNAGRQPQGAPASPPTNNAPSTDNKPATGDTQAGPRAEAGPNYKIQTNTCVLFDPPDKIATAQMCKNVCGDAVAKQVEAGQIASVTCSAFNSRPDIKPGQPPPPYEWKVQGGKRYQPGNCTCNSPMAEWAANEYVDALVKVGEVSKKVIIAAIEGAIAIGPMVIPGVGEAISGPMLACITTAKVAEYTYDAAKLGQAAFKTWAEGAGKISGDMGKAFDTFRKADSNLIPGGWKNPKWPKNSGKAGDKGNPDAPKEPAPNADKPPTNEPNKPPSNEPNKPPENDPKKQPDKDKEDEKDKDKQCKKQKRGDSSGQNKDCDKDKTITKTIIGKSIADPKPTKVACSVENYEHACAHYFSAMEFGGMDKQLECSDHHKRDHQENNRNDLTAVKDWKKQHNQGHGWGAYTADSYEFLAKGQKVPNEDADPRCQADEWPPAYFRDENHKAQLIRWIPGSQNSGAAKAWTGFCDREDGGRGNGAQNEEGEVDETKKHLFKFGNKDKQESKKVGQGTTTLYHTYTASFTRAVFSMDFGAWKEKPSESNDFLLKKNPCWPEAIVPDDPGFCLLNSDPYNVKHKPKNGPDRKDYENQPLQKHIQAAEQWVKHNQPDNISGKRPPSPGDPGTPPPDKAQQQGGKQRRALEVEDGQLYIRDDNFNSTRLLSDEEVKRDVEIIQCEDRTCSKERRDLGEDGTLVIPPKGPSMSPPEDVQAAATQIPLVKRGNEGMQTVQRRVVRADVPIATAAPF